MSANSNNPTPLGTLITLPPELRDQIYNHVLDMKYIVFWTYYHKERYPSSGGCTPTIPPDLSIRCVSKALSAEASARLFDATTFTFDIGFSYFHDRLSPLPATAATGRMMNVEFRVITGAGMEDDLIDMVEDDVMMLERATDVDDEVIPIVTTDGIVRGHQTVYHPALMDLICRASVEHFIGTEPKRNTLLVEFRDFGASFHLFMATRFFQTLKECAGFRTITLLLHFRARDDRDCNMVAVMEELQNVQTELQRCWGPCTVRDVFDRFRGRPVWTLFKLRYAFELTFRPLEFREGDRKAGGLRVGKEG